MKIKNQDEITAVVVAGNSGKIKLNQDYRQKVSESYSQVGQAFGNVLRKIVAFGALMDEVAAWLGATHGGARRFKSAAADLNGGLKAWLEENCPEVNYKTAVGYRALAGKAAAMIGGGTMAIAALQGRERVVAPGGDVIDVDAEVIEAREALFEAADSRRKLEQMFFSFMSGTEARHPDHSENWGGKRPGAGRPGKDADVAAEIEAVANSEAGIWASAKGALDTLVQLDSVKGMFNRLTDEHLGTVAKLLADLAEKSAEALGKRIGK